MEADGYSLHEHRPLAGYAALTAIFAGGFAAALLAGRARGGELPDRIAPWDVVLAGAATQKLSRQLARDKATSFLRAPFVRYQEPGSHGEVSEEPRGSGLRLAIGELVNCPFCLGQWTAGGFAAGMVAAPRLTRLLAMIYAAETVADFLQLAYAAASQRA